MKLRAICISATVALCGLVTVCAQDKEIVWSDQEKPIYQQIHDIRKVRMM